MSRLPMRLSGACAQHEIPKVSALEGGVCKIKGSGVLHDTHATTPITFESVDYSSAKYPITSVTQEGDGSISLPEKGNFFTCAVDQDVTAVTFASLNPQYLLLSPDIAGYTIDLSGQGYFFEGGTPILTLSEGKDLLFFQPINKVFCLAKRGFS